MGLHAISHATKRITGQFAGCQILLIAKLYLIPMFLDAERRNILLAA